jgi:hypothetical protein
MATQVQFRRGTTAQIAAFAGTQAEVVVDTSKTTCVVCDGSTPGGFPLLREDGTNTALSPGSLNSCALKFASNAGTGLISPSTGTLALVASGIQGLLVTSSGDLAIPGNVTLAGTLSLTGPVLRAAPSSRTTSFTVTPSVSRYVCNGTGTITVTLPSAATYIGFELLIKTVAAQAVVSGSSNVVPLTGGSQGTAILSAAAGKWASLVSDGTSWIIMSGN